LVARLLVELPQAKQARWPVDGGQQLAVYRGRLQRISSVVAKVAPSDDSIDLSRPGLHALPQWGGALEVTRTACGLPGTVLKACTLRTRVGGEQFQRAPLSTPRSLKKQYQDAGIAAWQRDGPLVYVDGCLLFVPGLGLDARWLSGTHTRRGLTLHWRSDGDTA
jgi:tRNA(Ile)-lysidine synthase